MDVIHTKTHDILSDGKYVQYNALKTGIVDWYSYNDELLKILSNHVYLDIDRHTGRTRFVVTVSGKTKHIRAHDLALGCYLGRIHAESFLSEWEEFVRYKHENNLTVDHIDGNGNNLTQLNLSLMERAANCRKYNTIQRIRLPNALSAAYVNGKYRVEFLAYPDMGDVEKDGISVRFLCDSAENFVHRLLWLTECRFEWATPIKERGKWIPTEGGYLYGDTYKSIQKQETLAMMDELEFVRSKDFLTG